MKAQCVSQRELVAAGFGSDFPGVSVARPETVAVPAVETTRLRAENSRMRFHAGT